MSTERLSPTSYVVLGLIALRGPSTPYDLKRAVSRSVGYFWTFPHSQLYAEPARLADLGLLKSAQERGGRNRRMYTITAAGRTALRAWLREPSGDPFELRDVAELQLFFGELGTTQDTRELARAQVALHKRRLAEFESIGEQAASRAGFEHRMAPLRLGVLLERATLRFWEGVLERPPRLARSRARSSRMAGLG